MYPSETQMQVRDMARQFADEVVKPLAEGLDREERFPHEIYEQMGELGLFGIGVPEAMGGPGFDTLTYALVMEELSRGYASVADQCGLVELISTLLVRHGTPAQREVFARRELAGERLAALDDGLAPDQLLHRVLRRDPRPAGLAPAGRSGGRQLQPVAFELLRHAAVCLWVEPGRGRRHCAPGGCRSGFWQGLATRT